MIMPVPGGDKFVTQVAFSYLFVSKTLIDSDFYAYYSLFLLVFIATPLFERHCFRNLLIFLVGNIYSLP